VVIAEDSVLLLAGLTKLLDSAGFEVCATAGDADELLAAVERERRTYRCLNRYVTIARLRSLVAPFALG